MELPDIVGIVAELGGTQVGDRESAVSRDARDAGVLTSCARSASATCEQTRIQRKTDAPFFIDKLPNNWAHVGLIHLMLPNAKIIDARRHPLELLLLGLQAALRARPAFHLRPRGHRPLLPRLRRS